MEGVEGSELESGGRRLKKTIAFDYRTYQVLQYLKSHRGFKTFDELVRDMIRAYVGLADPDGARRAYVELVRRACRELGSDARFYPTLLLKRYRGEIARKVEAYILAHQDEEVFCFLVLEGDRGSPA